MDPSSGPEFLSDREREVLEAVIRAYVETAEPAGSKALATRFDLGVSSATIRNTMAELESKGYLTHPHTSAGRVPTDLAYRFFVDRIVQPATITKRERVRLEREIWSGESAVERIVGNAARALGLLAHELGIASVPQLLNATLERLDLIQVSSNKVLMVATIRSGIVRTVYVDLPGEVPADTLGTLQTILNERLAGLSFEEIRRSLMARLQDAADPDTQETLNIFIESGGGLFAAEAAEPDAVLLGQTSVLAAQPEFSSGEQLKGLIELTEQRELLARVLGNRAAEGGLRVTIGGEHLSDELSDFTVVTSEYRVGGLKGVVGVMGPTRMPYEKIIAIVDYTSSLVTRMLEP